MGANDEFKKIYEELRKESLKDDKVNLNFENIVLDETLNTLKYEDFFEDKEFENDLINFISTYNRTNLINSPIYQKQKALIYFKDFISFQKILFKFKVQTEKEKQNDLKINSCLTIHPEKNVILNLSQDISINDGLKMEEKIIENKQNSSIENDKLNKNSTEDKKVNNSQGSDKNKNTENSFYSNKSRSFQSKSKKKEKQKDKDESNFNIETIEKSDGKSYEENSIDFIKYALLFSSLEKKVSNPEHLPLNFNDELLKKPEIDKNNLQPSIKLDLVVNNLSKKELEELITNLKNNIFLKEKLNLEKYANEQNFDLLIEVAKNYFSQSQDKFQQLYSYIALIKVMNLMKDSNDDELKKKYKDNCNRLKVSENNEKIFILITDGSYHLLSQIIKFSEKNKYENIKAQNDIEEKEYSFDYNDKVDKVLSNLIENTSLSKIFSKIKNNRNIPNLNRFLNILSEFEKNDVPHCIIYYEDDIKISIDNQIVNELIYQFKYNKPYLDKFYTGKFDLIEKKIHERDCINVLNLPFFRKINDFLNLLKTEEIKIKRLANKHYNYDSLEKDNKIKKLEKKFIEQFEGVSLFKNNGLKIYLEKNNESSGIISNYLKDLFTFESSLDDLKCKNYKEYMKNINGQITSWLEDIYNRYSSIKESEILFTENGKLSSNNIIEVIQYNINKYFNNQILIDKNLIDFKDLEYDETISEDKEFYNELSSILDGIMEKYQEIFNKDINIKDKIIFPLINNCKCHCLYSLLLNLVKKLCFINKNDIASGLMKILIKNQYI